MAVDLKMLDLWLQSPETEQLEFKEAKTQYGKADLLRYCVALSNEGGGHLVLGITDKLPRKVVGTQAFSSTTSLNTIKVLIIDKLRFRVEIFELQHEDGRVLVFEIPPRPVGQARTIDGTYLMRGGEGITNMTVDRLKLIFSEDQQDWFALPAHADASSEDVISLLDTQAYFDLLQIPYPTSRDAVLERLQSECFIRSTVNGWTITNLAAILLGKKLSNFPLPLARKAPRFVIYEGGSKQNTRGHLD